MTSDFSRSSAARVRPPKICGPTGSSMPANGENIRHAATPTAAAPKMIRLRTMIPAGLWPSDRKTTIVAPTRPASVKNCQGVNAESPSRTPARRGARGWGSVEVAELIVQAGVDGWIDARVAGGRKRWPRRPATGGNDDGDEADDADDIGERPRDTVESPVDRRGQHFLAAEVAHERRDDLIVILPFGEIRGQLFFLALVARTVQHAARADGEAAAARADDLALDLTMQCALLLNRNGLLGEQRGRPHQHREQQHRCGGRTCRQARERKREHRIGQQRNAGPDCEDAEAGPDPVDERVDDDGHARALFFDTERGHD